MQPGFGVELAKGTQIVMQVHYNLLAGRRARPLLDAAAARTSPGSS